MLGNISGGKLLPITGCGVCHEPGRVDVKSIPCPVLVLNLCLPAIAFLSFLYVPLACLLKVKIFPTHGREQCVLACTVVCCRGVSFFAQHRMVKHGVLPTYG